MHYVPYMTIGNDLEVTHSVRDKKDEPVLVYFEKPDPVFFFKMAEFDIEKMTLVRREGFTDEELMPLADFCRNNRNLILKYEPMGGIVNA